MQAELEAIIAQLIAMQDDVPDHVSDELAFASMSVAQALRLLTTG